MNNFLPNKKIILASGSPRRQQYCRELGLDFSIQLKEVEEIYPENLKHHQITDFLAELKANAFENELAENEILITSDTIVWHENKALGKPKDFDEAFEMIRSMCGKTHEVITSVCIKTSSKTEIFHSITKVTFINLTKTEIDYYITNYKPFDKAGAYGIQEWIGLVGIAKIEGSYPNVVGLPVDKLYAKLKEYA
ncbi:Maf family nucleotide pyrophosphatase [Flavobacterium sp.]|uniref:Maf family nucleotide pyrophosphatase n=1 Tax=Flavobacterium sp. TaxID=239 RepID=UPI003F69EA83